MARRSEYETPEQVPVDKEALAEVIAYLYDDESKDYEQTEELKAKAGHIFNSVQVLSDDLEEYERRNP